MPWRLLVTTSVFFMYITYPQLLYGYSFTGDLTISLFTPSQTTWGWMGSRSGQERGCCPSSDVRIRYKHIGRGVQGSMTAWTHAILRLIVYYLRNPMAARTVEY
ncbi:hypothetical protein F5Y09DRAFT_298107 [Xylaria sp. FL1042]|nr:hypothetical protein F5Y09DRAFT_298107 [Xylaria sp. FL1042]